VVLLNDREAQDSRRLGGPIKHGFQRSSIAVDTNQKIKCGRNGNKPNENGHHDETPGKNMPNVVQAIGRCNRDIGTSLVGRSIQR
jgi:hypothetical protein